MLNKFLNWGGGAVLGVSLLLCLISLMCGEMMGKTQVWEGRVLAALHVKGALVALNLL